MRDSGVSGSEFASSGSKVRGEKSQASEYYRRYLKVQPSGPRAAMAQKNLRDLEPKGAPKEEKKEDEPKKEEQALPKPPPTPPIDEPPPP